MNHTEAKPDRIKLSAVLITLNAGAQLQASLESVRFCDDLVIVDSGSTDNTLDIAAAYGARIFRRDWAGFGLQKQFAVAQARNDWVLCIDADEQISPTLEEAIDAVMSMPEPERLPAYFLPRCNRFLGRYLRHGEGYPDWVLRLFDRNQAQWSDDTVHEKVVLNPKGIGAKTPGRLNGDLLHESAESLSRYLDKQNRYTSMQAVEMATRGKKPHAMKMAVSPMVRFLKFYVLRRGFLDGWQGFAHIAIGCFFAFVKYAKAREAAQTKPKQDKK